MGAAAGHVRPALAEECSTPETSVSSEEALVILEPYFRAAQEEFVAHERRHYGKKQLSRVKLECRPWAELHEELGFSTRNFAATREDGRLIVVAPELVELPEESVAAILAHEFGHAYDYLYPSRFALADGELLRFDDVPEGHPKAEQARVARMTHWHQRDRDEVEHLADAVATEVLGQEIRYAGPCLLQTFQGGITRPKHLR